METMETIVINGVEYVRKDSIKPGVVINTDNIVLIRTYSAGVHFGTLDSRDGKEVVLSNARRLYQWSGACSLSQVAMDGVDLANSKISVIVPKITLTEAIEIIPMSETAARTMMEAKSWKKQVMFLAMAPTMAFLMALSMYNEHSYKMEGI